MKCLLQSVALITLVILVGCQNETGDLDILQPDAVSIAPGESKQVTVTISRTRFDNPVHVQITQLPIGVTVAEPAIVMSGESTTATFTLNAAEDAAAVENHTAAIVAQPQENQTPVETKTFTITVSKG